MSEVSTCIQVLKSLRCMVKSAKKGNFQSFTVFRPMFIFSGRAPRAGLETLAARIRPAGRSLETPGVWDRRRYSTVSIKRIL